MLLQNRIDCKDVLNPTPVQLAATRRLYESTLGADERIPWAWLERSVRGKAFAARGSWAKHLILATPADEPDVVAGYLFGTYMPGFAGYVSYMGVDDRYRGMGIGTKLYETAFAVFQRDAAMVDESLPFVLWESRPPDHGAEQEVWTARAKLFDKLGGFWAEGLDIWAPNYEVEYEPLPYQLFVKPIATPAKEFSPGRIRRIVHDHYRRVYKQRPGDELYTRSLAHRPRPRLRPALMAAKMMERV